MSIKDIMDVNPDTLRKHQHSSLTVHVCGVLDKIRELIIAEKYDDIEAYIQASPAGDDMGNDNCYIDFGWEGTVCDIDDAITMLKNLQQKC